MMQDFNIMLHMMKEDVDIQYDLQGYLKKRQFEYVVKPFENDQVKFENFR